MADVAGRTRRMGQLRRRCCECTVRSMATRQADAMMSNWLNTVYPIKTINSVEPIAKYAKPLRKLGREKSQTCLGNSINTVYEIGQQRNSHNAVVGIAQRILRQEQAKFEEQKLLALAADKKGVK